jgi:glycosyltransferase involved in cell wall biosynthesis
MVLMKIAFDNIDLGSSNGNSVYTTGLIKALAATFTDNEYHLFTYWRKKKRAQEAVGAVPAVRVNNILPHPLILGKICRPAVNAINAGVMRHAVAKADLYHCTNPAHFTFGIKKTVVTVLDLIALRKEDWVSRSSKDFYQENIARIVAESRVVFTISNHSRADILHHFPGAEDKIVVTYLGVDERFRCLP